MTRLVALLTGIALSLAIAGTHRQAVAEWPNGGMPFPKADIRSPEDFAEIAELYR